MEKKYLMVTRLVPVSEALRKWDELAPSVLDIYYVFILCNTIDWCMNVWTEINYFKINEIKMKQITEL
jgi:hypothetical protein